MEYEVKSAFRRIARPFHTDQSLDQQKQDLKTIGLALGFTEEEIRAELISYAHPKSEQSMPSSARWYNYRGY